MVRPQDSDNEGNQREHNKVREGNSAVKHWIKDEKYYLLQGLRAFGSHNITNIMAYIPTKTANEISEAIEFYKQELLCNPSYEQKKKINNKERLFPKPRPPLAAWAKLLIDAFGLDDLQTETAIALRILADLEIRPKPVHTENSDLRKIYRIVSSAMEGKSLVGDKMSTAMLNKCIIETALSSKAFIKTSAYKYVINSIDLNSNEETLFPRLTEDHELDTLRFLSAQRKYNPLKVPEEYMTHSTTVWNNFDYNQELKPNRPIPKNTVILEKQDLFQ